MHPLYRPPDPPRPHPDPAAAPPPRPSRPLTPMKPAWRPPSPGRLPSTAALLLVLLSNAFAAGAQEIHLTGLAGEPLSDADLAQGTTIALEWASWSPRRHDILDRMQPLAGPCGAQ